MVHHLLATSSNGNDLTKLSSLLNETVQFLANALHSVATFVEVAAIGTAWPLPNGALVTSSVAEAAIATVSCLLGDIGKEVLCSSRNWSERTLGDIDLHWAKATGIISHLGIVDILSSCGWHKCRKLWSMVGKRQLIKCWALWLNQRWIIHFKHLYAFCNQCSLHISVFAGSSSILNLWFKSHKLSEI